MTSAQDAWVLASADKEVSDRLWRDPAGVGKELGLRGAALAELIGGVRFGIRGRDGAGPAMEAIRAAINVENGWGDWPFIQAGDSEWPRFVSITEDQTRSIERSHFYGANSDDSLMTHRRSWAAALRAEAIRRADASEDVSVEVADALIAATNLLSACDRARR